MRLQRGVKGFLLGCVIAWLSVASAFASPYHGQVTFNGLPLPGSVVTVTATQGDKKVVAISDDQGLFSFADLADGTWSLDIEMTGFAPLKQQISVAANAPVATFEMRLMTLDEMRSAAKPVKVDATLLATATPVSAPATGAAAPSAAGTTPAAAAGKGAAPAAGKQAAAGGPAAPAAPEPAQDSTSAQANDGFLINGSVNNAATSQFSLNQAFGNNRNGGRWKYNGGLSLVLRDSVLDARTFSLNGEQTPKQPYTNIVAGAQIGGPLQIPHLIPFAKAPYFYAGYQRTENKNDSVATVRVPTQAQQLGDLTGAGTVYDPSTGLPYTATGCSAALLLVDATPTACIPASELNTPASLVAQKLLKYYPLPNNSTAASQYNFQIPLASSTHMDQYSGRVQKQLGSKNNLSGNVQVQDSRTSTPNQSGFGFLDTSRLLNTGVGVSYYHRFTQRLSMNASYNFSISKNNYFGYFPKIGDNVSADVGISGNDQAASYYGPPGLNFASSQFAGLSDGTNSSSRPETNSISYYMTWNRFRHNMTFGGDFRRQEWNSLSESNPKGSLTFTGVATQGAGGVGGNDFADFLLGRPDASSIAYGNADKYLRQSAYDLYADDDFRVNPELSVRAGVRWEFGAPVTETKNRLVNLDVAPNFTAVAPVLGTNPKGSVSGNTYPTSLLHPDYSFPEPRIGIAWRPISGSSLLVNAGYGIYNDTSVYRGTAAAMSQQAPLSTSLQVTATNPVVTPAAACPFTIAIGTPFLAPANCPQNTLDSFAVDPHFRVGYAQQWQLQVRRDLPFSLQLSVTYTGIKGTRGVQEIMPNSYAPGLLTSPYGAAPTNFYYRMSNGNSTKESGSVQLRRRLRNGLTANLTYTFSKALDDDLSLGGQGPVITSGGNQQVAQDWTNPAGNRGLSTFDQRNVLSASLQYTTGMGIGGGTLLSGWRGLIYKEWTAQVNISEASGTPLTPITSVIAPGTSFQNVIRASYGTQAGCSQLPGEFLNPCRYVVPGSPGIAPGFGNARRDSITGPSQFGLNASLDRSWRLHDRYNIEARVDANNVLNHVAYSSWNTTVVTLPACGGTGEPSCGTTPLTQFGLPNPPGGMRSLTITLRGRF
jgi:hypothetical protein